MPRNTARNVTAIEQNARNANVTVSGTSAELASTRLGKSRRVLLAITPLSAGVVCNVAFGDEPAQLNQGLVLNQSQPYVEADSEGFTCWQGAVQIIASGNGSVSVLERYE